MSMMSKFAAVMIYATAALWSSPVRADPRVLNPHLLSELPSSKLVANKLAANSFTDIINDLLTSNNTTVGDYNGDGLLDVAKGDSEPRAFNQTSSGEIKVTFGQDESLSDDQGTTFKNGESRDFVRILTNLTLRRTFSTSQASMDFASLA